MAGWCARSPASRGSRARMWCSGSTWRCRISSCRRCAVEPSIACVLLDAADRRCARPGVEPELRPDAVLDRSAPRRSGRSCRPIRATRSPTRRSAASIRPDRRSSRWSRSPRSKPAPSRRDTAITCPGYLELGDATFHCWRKGGHGTLHLRDAIKKSCDVFFYETARRTGIDRIAAMARRFGFGAALGLDIPGERGGLIPTRDWKLATTGTSWQQGETLIAGIGQGSVLATPLQVATMAARLVTGRAVVPHLVRERGVLPPGGDQRLPDFPGARHRPAPPRPRARRDERGGERAGRDRLCRAHHRSRPGDGRQIGHLAGAAHHPIRARPRVAQGHRDPVEGARPRAVCRRSRRSVRRAMSAPSSSSMAATTGGGGSAVAAPICRDVLIEVQRRDPARRVPQPDSVSEARRPSCRRRTIAGSDRAAPVG